MVVRLRTALVLVLLTALALAACSGDDDGEARDRVRAAIDDGGNATETTSEAGDATTITSGVEGLTVGQALGIGPSEVRVRGFVVAEEGAPVRLCTSLVGEPPQCGGPFLEVQGLDLARVPGLEAVAGATPPARATRTELALRGLVQQGLISVTEQPS